MTQTDLKENSKITISEWSLSFFGNPHYLLGKVGCSRPSYSHHQDVGVQVWFGEQDGSASRPRASKSGRDCKTFCETAKLHREFAIHTLPSGEEGWWKIQVKRDGGKFCFSEWQICSNNQMIPVHAACIFPDPPILVPLVCCGWSCQSLAVVAVSFCTSGVDITSHDPRKQLVFSKEVPLAVLACSPSFSWLAFVHALYDWTTGMQDNGTEWMKFRVVPRFCFFLTSFNRSGNRKGF